MEHAGGSQHEHSGDSSDQLATQMGDRAVQGRLRDRTHEGECEPDAVEREDLVLRGQQRDDLADFGQNRVRPDINIRAQGKLRAVLPGLEPSAVQQLVRGLPVVVHLIAIRNGVGCGAKHPDEVKDAEGRHVGHAEAGAHALGQGWSRLLSRLLTMLLSRLLTGRPFAALAFACRLGHRRPNAWCWVRYAFMAWCVWCVWVCG